LKLQAKHLYAAKFWCWSKIVCTSSAGSIYLTLFRRCRNVPLLFEGEGQQGEVCHPQPVMLNEA